MAMHPLRLRPGDSGQGSGLATCVMDVSSMPPTKLCAGRRIVAHGCSCPGLLTDPLSKLLVMIHRARAMQTRSPGGRGINRAARRGGPPPEPPLEDDFEVPESETATFDPAVDPDKLDGLPPQLPPDKAALHGYLRHDQAPALQPRLRHLRRRLSQRPRARRHGSQPSHGWTPKEVMTCQVVPSSSSSTSWHPRMRPARGVRWRGGAPPAPPLWKYEQNDLRTASSPRKLLNAEWFGDVGLDAVELAAQPSSGDRIRLGRRRRLSGMGPLHNRAGPRAGNL